MAKLFEIVLKVEDTDVIGALRVLHRMPWAKDIEADFTQLLPNGQGRKRQGREPLALPPPSRANRKPKKTTKHGGETGAKFLLRTLGANGPMTQKQMETAFERDGRAPGSVPSSLHLLQHSSLLKKADENHLYALTTKGQAQVNQKKE